ncbi:hypothetical protein FRAAL1539 [Frankia alni ACN14a]|uniref:Uncharacterized protein n=1 Tax=Frankia alni (strain DSM 45986 / CECT 9034 / ACN14a) TaxID=326424 RepID=Q0RQH9_FRAAA|nr:hypothetical protein FRAAL1539 [Frankia alni ACN14a]
MVPAEHGEPFNTAPRDIGWLRYAMTPRMGDAVPYVRIPGASATSKGPGRNADLQSRAKDTGRNRVRPDRGPSARCRSHHIHDRTSRPGRIASIPIDAAPYTTRARGQRRVVGGWRLHTRPGCPRPGARTQR